ncbi:hypothetical protein N5D16_15835 [Acinetobacter johnsonii]|uniref:hypothetical protein n=1 Tax=Acinetobacter johnsonii TaxID=40214 RepID=UPI002447BCD5|nr:hypothetical protein [Acinetobacter johnsonii]MDH1365862.1 hypothetical protein [Acinetobacter johnsonii]MDH1520437.1 hypothetical protein [Acinetobacter johnsonii]
MKIFFLSSLCLCFLLTPSLTNAIILGGVEGNAKEWVKVGCDSCCYVENKSQKRVSATMALSLGASITEIIFPNEKKYFYIGSTCMTSAFGIFVNFKDD